MQLSSPPVSSPSTAPNPCDTGMSDASPTVATAVTGGRRAATTLFDQGFSSASNFAVGVAVARAAGAAGLGAFAFAYAGWLVIADMHRALITDPMAIEGDVRGPNASPGIQRGFAAEVLLGLAAALIFAVLGAALMLVHAHTFGLAMLCLAPWLPAATRPGLLAVVSFMRQQPGRALANDTVFNCVQGSVFVAIFVDSRALSGCGDHGLGPRRRGGSDLRPSPVPGHTDAARWAGAAAQPIGR